MGQITVTWGWFKVEVPAEFLLVLLLRTFLLLAS